MGHFQKYKIRKSKYLPIATSLLHSLAHTFEEGLEAVAELFIGVLNLTLLGPRVVLIGKSKLDIHPTLIWYHWSFPLADVLLSHDSSFEPLTFGF